MQTGNCLFNVNVGVVVRGVPTFFYCVARVGIAKCCFAQNRVEAARETGEISTAWNKGQLGVFNVIPFLPFLPVLCQNQNLNQNQSQKRTHRFFELVLPTCLALAGFQLFP